MAAHVKSKHVKGTCILCVYGDAEKGKLTCVTCSLKHRRCASCEKSVRMDNYSHDDMICNTCAQRVMLGGMAHTRSMSRVPDHPVAGPSGLQNLINHAADQTPIQNVPVQHALDGAVSKYNFDTGNNGKDVLMFLQSQTGRINNILREELPRRNALKASFSLHIVFGKEVERDGELLKITTTAYFNIPATEVLNDDDIDRVIEETIVKLKNRVEEFEGLGSGWSVDNINDLEMSITTYHPFSSGTYIPTPSGLRGKHAIVNVKSNDGKCFMWSILASLHHPTNVDRVASYKEFEHELNLDGISFPTPISHIDKFEENNNISVSVFCYESPFGDQNKHMRHIYPRRISKLANPTHTVNLLLLEDSGKLHYAAIRDMSRLICSRTKHNGRSFICSHCLQVFSSEEFLQKHKPNCTLHGEQKVTLPKEGENILKFKAIQHQLKAPFTIYCDFESVLEKIDDVDPTQTTRSYQKHRVSSYSYVVVSSNENLTTKPVLYRGKSHDGVIEHFYNNLLREKDKINNILRNPVPMIFTDENKNEFDNAINCHICMEPLNEDRVKNHDHINGLYLGASHNKCNLEFRYKRNIFTNEFIIPVIFHNLRSYDSHLFLKDIGRLKPNITVIANNMERYVSFSIDQFRFIDSLQFLNESLEKLVNNLHDDGPDKFKLLAKFFPADKLPHLLRKGVFCYNYIDSFERFNDLELPSRDKFFNDLIDEECSVEDYNHACCVFKEFNHTNLGDYHDLYLMSDVILLADVFENFRDRSLKNYGLDPVHYFGIPGFAWDAMLKMTGVELELITDYDLYLMFENAIRGGVSVISHRHAVANNQYLNDYDPEDVKRYLMYLDKNSLYATTMTEPLPIGDFLLLSEEEIETLFHDIMNIPDDAHTGYVLEVDLDYPAEIHDYHNDLPMAPENINITPEMLSPYCRELFDKIHCEKEHRGKTKPSPEYKGSRKLAPNLYNKKHYTCHYRNLKQYLAAGLKLTKIHRVVSFTQKPWMKKFIEFNTEKRKLSTNNFDKGFYKLVSNAVFGKAMENVRKYKNVQLLTDAEKMKKVASKPQFIQSKIFTEDLVAVNLRHLNVKLFKPIYIGMSILDLSKTFVFDFHYSYIKPKYGNRAKLLFTDTDSLTYVIETDDIYQDMYQDKHQFDFSGYPHDHPCYNTENKKVLGKMKDELNGIPLKSFCGLRAKMYSLTDGHVEKKTAKGINRCVTEKILTHAHFEKCLFEGIAITNDVRRIHSVNHTVYTSVITKSSLSAFDDKRYILPDKVSTLAYGHHSIISD